MARTSKNTAAEAQATASALLRMLATGKGRDAHARIRRLSQADYIAVTRLLQQLENALCEYAEGWKNAEYWGRGVDFPA